MKPWIMYAGLAVWLICRFNASAGITFNGTNISVSNYPAAAPATLSDIRTADSNGAWGIVQYNPTNDTTTLTNGLIVGAANGTNSYFQIGRTNYPAETLVMRGELRVKMASPSCLNGILLGTDATNTVHPVLKFDCSFNNQFGLWLENGARLSAYNAVIAGTSTNRTLGWYGYKLVTQIRQLYMTNTALLNGTLYPFDTVRDVVDNCTYANAPYALKNAAGYFQGCIFSNLDVALLDDGGTLECTLIGCTFVTNSQNWTMRYTDRGIRAVDCRIGTPRDTNIVCQPYFDATAAHWHYPSFMSQRHIVVHVKNTGGDPITNATVTVSNEQENAEVVVHGMATTGTNGLTPAIDSERALFVMDYLYRATDDAAHPLYQSYTYTLTATAPGYGINTVTGVDPDESWTTQEMTLVP